MATQVTKGKRELIDKANASMVIAIAVAGFVVVFALFACKALWSQRTYQAKVISKKTAAVDQLNKNKETVKKLADSYKVFINTPDNVIGGNPNGTGDKDGNNAKIVLDALPSKYDFPAFITSVEKLLRAKNFTPKTIAGNDDEIAQSPEVTSGKGKNAPVEIPFKFTAETGNYARTKELLTTLELSIRPIKVNKLTITGGDSGEVSVNIDAVSFYQPAKGLTIKQEVVK